MKKKKTAAISAAAFVLAIWTIWGNVSAGISRCSVMSSKLPGAFDHYKIAHVSDLHNAEFGKENSVLTGLIKKEKPDIIAITGDLVDAKRTDIELALNFIKELKKIAPCYYVTGNHEAWIGERYQLLEEEMLGEGVVILHDSSELLTKDNEEIQIAGLDDPDFTGRDTFAQESRTAARLHNMDLGDEYCILLSHRPEMFEEYVSEGIDLVLSGHAHGGQFRIPFIGGLIAPDQGVFPKYDAGMYSEKDTTMIVSRGLGNSIIPFRINNRPEIGIVELVCE